MTAAKECFTEIMDQFPLRHPEAQHGNMMRSPALTVKGKVFCFYYEAQDQMVFKLGKNIAMDRPELEGATLLNPFKNKGPLKGWYVVPFVHKETYDALAEEAFEKCLAK